MNMKNMNEWNKGKWIFKDIHGYGYPYPHVHPYKQEAVKYLVDNKPDWITHIIVFGSSVRKSHLWTSDLDICVLGGDFRTTEELVNIRLKEIKYDFLCYSDKGLLFNLIKIGSVEKYITEEGVMVYER